MIVVENDRRGRSRSIYNDVIYAYLRTTAFWKTGSIDDGKRSTKTL